MGLVKHALETYEELDSLRDQLTESDHLPDEKTFAARISRIFKEWSLDPYEIAEESGVSITIVRDFLEETGSFSKSLHLPNFPQYSLKDARKLVDALARRFDVSGSNYVPISKDVRHTFDYDYVKELGGGARVYFEVGALSVEELEQSLCNASGENHIPILGDISEALKQVSLVLPNLAEEPIDTEDLMREMAVLRSKVVMLTQERDRLLRLLEASKSDLKTGFLTQLGAAPVIAGSALIGSLFGAKEAESLIEFVQLYLHCGSNSP